MKPTVYCVLKSGGRYNLYHVGALVRMVAQHISSPYRFICLTDWPQVSFTFGAGVFTELKDGLPGWYSKIELFNQPVHGPCLYLDLDTIITGNIDHLFYEGAGIMMAEDPRYPTQPNSSVMSWSEIQRHVYDEFKKDVLGNVHKYNIGGYVGDQAFIKDHADWKLYQNAGIQSFRHDLEKQRAEPSKDSCLVMFHGKMKPWDKGMPKWCNDFYTAEELKGMRNV